MTEPYNYTGDPYEEAVEDQRRIEEEKRAREKPETQYLTGKPAIVVQEPKRLPAAMKNMTVSQATLRAEDLIQRFMAVLAVAWPTKAEWLMVEYGLDVEPLDIDGEAAVEQLGQEEASWLISDLFDALGEVAPEGCGFGAHEGDGALFGFWEYDVEEAEVTPQ